MSVFGDQDNLSLSGLELMSLGLSPLTQDSAATQGPCLPDFLENLNTPQKYQPVPTPLLPLASHPLFCDLQSILREECQPATTPFSLLSASQAAQDSVDITTAPLSVRIGMLQMRFLRVESMLPAETGRCLKDLQDAYSTQSANMESDRFSGLQSARTTPWFYPSINMYYDHCHHQLIERVQRSLLLLENRCALPQVAARSVTPACPRPTQQPTRGPLNFAPPGTPGAPLTSTPKRSPPVIRKQELSAVALGVMSAWYERNPEHPYPSYETAEVMAKAGGNSVEQVKKWFANRRSRDGRTKTLTEIAKRRKRCRDEDDTILTASKHARHC